RPAAAARGRGVPGARPGAHDAQDGRRAVVLHALFRAQVAQLAAAQARAVPRARRLRRRHPPARHARAHRMAGAAAHRPRHDRRLFRRLLGRRRPPAGAAGAGRYPDGGRRPGDPDRRIPRAGLPGGGARGDRALGRPLRLPRGRALRRLRRTLGGGAAGGGRVALRPRYPEGRHLKETTMRIRSDSFEHRGAIPAEFAMGAPDGFGGNRNPHLAWDDVPEGTKSFALLCIDTDAPTDASLAGREDVEIPVAHPRGDFVHWVVADIPATLREIAAGSASDGITMKGKRAPSGIAGARQGLNDYTGWFAGNDDMR